MIDAALIGSLRAYAWKFAAGAGLDADDVFGMVLEILARHLDTHGSYVRDEFELNLHRRVIDEVRREYGRPHRWKAKGRRAQVPLDPDVVPFSYWADPTIEEAVAADTLRHVLVACRGNARREQIVRCRARGMSQAATSRALGISERAVGQALQIIRSRTLEVEPC